MAVSCSNCGGPHPVWDCRAKSTAEKLGSPNARREVLGNVAGVTQVAGSGVSPPVTRQAGTQALPVDTNLAKAGNAPHITAGLRAPDTGVAGTKPACRGPGQESGASKFDKKAWSREYMSGYMKKYRAEVKAGTRVPKRKGEK